MQSPQSDPAPARGATHRMSRLVRWLAGRNALRRPVDSIEGAILVTLAAAFLVAVAVAFILGTHTYLSQRADNPSPTRSSQRQIRWHLAALWPAFHGWCLSGRSSSVSGGVGDPGGHVLAQGPHLRLGMPRVRGEVQLARR